MSEIPSSTRIEEAKFAIRAEMALSARPRLSAPPGGPADNDLMDKTREQNLRERLDRLYAELLEAKEELEEAHRLLAQIRFEQLDRGSCDDPPKEA